MRTIKLFLIAFFFTATAMAQEDYQRQIEQLIVSKDQVTEQEKEALKLEVEAINQKLANKEIDMEEAKLLKENAAEKRALNIADRLAIINNKISLLERNRGEVLQTPKAFRFGQDPLGLSITVNNEPWQIFEHKEPKYDRKTYSDFVFAVGLNNAIIEGQSLSDSPYKIAGSRFAELGWSWRTRILPNSNFIRFNYGFSFQFNGLKPKGNEYFVAADGETTLQEFEFDLNKSKFRTDNLVFPLYLEFGPSKIEKSTERIRYNIDKKFRLGIGGYGGFNLSARQKLKYTREGETVKDKLKRGYDTNDFVYGLAGYAGVGGVLFYLKYDLNPIFKDAQTDQRNVSLGLRFDL
ncbi:MAG: hypothetical protein WBN39_00830 [Flavobacteriaceae bacterium]